MQRVVGALQSAIRTGLLVPGKRLVETSLATDLGGVKRGTVREALRILAGDGVVELLPRRGACVRQLTAEDALEMLPALGALLNASIQLAAPHIGEPAVRAKLDEAIEHLKLSTRNHDERAFQRGVTSYVDTLLKAHGNRYIAYLYGKLHPDLFHMQLAQALKVSQRDDHVAAFERMHIALMAGDPIRATAALRAQGQRMREALAHRRMQDEAA